VRFSLIVALGFLLCMPDFANAETFIKDADCGEIQSALDAGESSPSQLRDSLVDGSISVAGWSCEGLGGLWGAKCIFEDGSVDPLHYGNQFQRQFGTITKCIRNDISLAAPMKNAAARGGENILLWTSREFAGHAMMVQLGYAIGDTSGIWTLSFTYGQANSPIGNGAGGR